MASPTNIESVDGSIQNFFRC